VTGLKKNRKDVREYNKKKREPCEGQYKDVKRLK